jgi:chromosomal replication initiator protein
MNLSVERIQRETALYYGIGLEKLLCDDRRWDWSHPRQVAMYLASRLTSCSNAILARLFGRHDPGTIRHGFKQVHHRIHTDEATKAHVGAILNRLFA